MGTNSGRKQKITYRDILVEANRGDILAADGRVLSSLLRPPHGFTGSRPNRLSVQSNIDSLAICLSQFFGDRSWYSYRSELPMPASMLRIAATTP